MADESLEVAEVLAAAERGEADVADLRKAIKPHVAKNSGQNEWYTPAAYIEAARAVLLNIDLDPASSDVAQRTVGASLYFTSNHDGLTKHWEGSVWLNPPYSQPLIGKFIQKLVEHVDGFDVIEAIVLVNNATETQWGQTLLERAAAICFPSGRIRFVDPDGNLGAPLQGQMIVCIGTDALADRFADHFSQFGIVTFGAGNG
jgi:ParB family chromosome partitioning protein